jgi:hypothetical protein
MFRWRSAADVCPASDGVSSEWSHSSQPFAQFCALLMFRGGYFVRFRKRQLGVIAKANPVFAVGQIGLATGYGYFRDFRLG